MTDVDLSHWSQLKNNEKKSEHFFHLSIFSFLHRQLSLNFFDFAFSLRVSRREIPIRLLIRREENKTRQTFPFVVEVVLAQRTASRVSTLQRSLSSLVCISFEDDDSRCIVVTNDSFSCLRS